MGCNEIEELLSAYANNEATEEEKKTVEEHLGGCKDCREKLERLREVRQKLATLREVPAPAMTADAISAVVSGKSASNPFGSWKVRAFTAVPLVIIIVLLAVFQPWSSPLGPDAVLAKAHDAVATISSFRVSIGTISDEGTVKTYETEFVAPDRFHIWQDYDGEVREYIVIGDAQYYSGTSSPSTTILFQPGMFSSMITTEFTMNRLDLIKDVVQLEDGEIEGVDCLHYRGTYDYEKKLRDRSGSGLPPASDEDIQEALEDYRSRVGEETISLWIGKEDYLVRQMTLETTPSAGSGETGTHGVTYTYSNFNEPPVIEAPLDDDGNLLEGWHSTVPDQSIFKYEQETSIDDSDPAHRMISYVITIKNTSTESVTISVSAIPMNVTQRIWIRNDSKEQNYLAAGHSTTYGMTFGYDPRETDTAYVAAALEKTGINVSYQTPEGEQKIDVYHFTVPDDFSTLPTDQPFVIDLTPVNEYLVTEEGVSGIGLGVLGKINGKHYLFVKLNTQNSDLDVPPGILVLDIDDPVKPARVAYVPSSAKTEYLLQISLSGTELFVGADTYVRILDVSDLLHPRELSRIDGLKASSIIASETTAYIFDNSKQQIITLDVSDPSNPQIVGNLDFPSRSSVSLTFAGDYILAESLDVLYTIDASSPGSLKIVDERTFTFPDGTPAHVSVAKNDDCIYITLNADEQNGLLIQDISNPLDPQEISYLALPGQYLSGPAFVYDDTAYILGRSLIAMDRKQRVNIIDISDPANPRHMGYARTPEFWTFFENSGGSGSAGYQLINGYLYGLFGSAPEQPRIEIFDLAGLTG